VLREFAKRIKALTRGVDLVARYGGEEIVVIVPDAALDEARFVAERIRERIGSVPFALDRKNKMLDVTVSIGVAAREPGDTSADLILKRADVALYRAKEEGRNRVVAAAA
jgi:two-component system, cell cycle response regulator